MRIRDWSSDVCSSDLPVQIGRALMRQQVPPGRVVHGRLAGADGGIDIGGIGGGHRGQRLVVGWIAGGQRPALTGPIGMWSCRERGCQYCVISVVAVSVTNKKIDHSYISVNIS